jgi:hypothetical protein
MVNILCGKLNIKCNGKIKTDVRQTAKYKNLGFVPEYSGTQCLLS